MTQTIDRPQTQASPAEQVDNRMGWLAIVVVAIFSFLSGGLFIIFAQDSAPAIISQCPTEDSDNCFWDADEQGNEWGRSFVVIDGEQIFIRENR